MIDKNIDVNDLLIIKNEDVDVCYMSYTFYDYNMDGDVIWQTTYYNNQVVMDEGHCDLAFSGWVRSLTFRRAAGLLPF